MQIFFYKVTIISIQSIPKIIINIFLLVLPKFGVDVYNLHIKLNQEQENSELLLIIQPDLEDLWVDCKQEELTIIQIWIILNHLLKTHILLLTNLTLHQILIGKSITWVSTEDFGFGLNGLQQEEHPMILPFLQFAPKVIIIKNYF